MHGDELRGLHFRRVPGVGQRQVEHVPERARAGAARLHVRGGVQEGVQPGPAQAGAAEGGDPRGRHRAAAGVRGARAGPWARARAGSRAEAGRGLRRPGSRARAGRGRRNLSVRRLRAGHPRPEPRRPRAGRLQPELLQRLGRRSRMLLPALRDDELRGAPQCGGRDAARGFEKALPGIKSRAKCVQKWFFHPNGPDVGRPVSLIPARF